MTRPLPGACRPIQSAMPGFFGLASCPNPLVLSPPCRFPLSRFPYPTVHLRATQRPVALPSGPKHRLRSDCRAGRTPRLDMPLDKNRSQAQPLIFCHIGLASKTLCGLNRPQPIRERFAPRRPLWVIAAKKFASLGNAVRGVSRPWNAFKELSNSFFMNGHGCGPDRITTCHPKI